MPSSYPGGLDELNGGVGGASDPLSSPSHPAHHTALADAVEAVQAELGLDPAGAAATVKARLDALDTTVGGKIASGLVDVKGDLIVATAADTVGRVGVGANGHVLTADSAQTAGVKWAEASGSGDPTMGGDLSGTASNAQIVAGAVTDTEVAAGNKDGAAGTASMRTLGTGSTQAAAGNDARLSDARTPTAHTTSHAIGGTDVLTPGDIGAATAAHNHSGVYEPADSDLTAIAGLSTSGLVERTGAGTAAIRTIGAGGASSILTRSDGDTRWSAAAHDHDATYVGKALVDAKGDIVTATADNTPARLAVGADSHVLTADSSQATGLKWAAAGGGGPISSPCLARSGHYYMSIFGAVPLTTVSINGYDRVFYVPIIFDNTTTVNNIGIYLNVVGTAGAGSATCALGIYASSADHQPTSRIVSAGTLDLTATIGSRFIAISQSLTARTLYWLAFTHGLQGTAPQMRGPTYASQFGMPLLGAHNLDSFNNSITAQWNRGTYGWIETRTYDGTLPSSAGTLSALRVFDLNIPAVCVSLS